MEKNPYESPPSNTFQPVVRKRLSLLGIVAGLLCVVAFSFALIMFLVPIVLLYDDGDWGFLMTARGSMFLGMIIGNGVASVLLANAAWSSFQKHWKQAGISFAVGTSLAGGMAWVLQHVAQH